MGNNTNQFTARVRIIRARTWTLSVTIIALLALYIFVTLSIKSKIDWIDFALTAAIQISTHFAYFPDGERYGELDKIFQGNRKVYNTKSAQIITTDNSSVEKLREFCEYDFEERKARHIADECAKIGVSVEEYAILAQKSKAELKTIEKLEWNGKVLYFTPKRRRAVIKLVFGKNPVKANNPETILSAVDRDYTEAIKDGSQTYRKAQHAARLFKSIVIGGILAYIGYNMRDGLSFAAIVKSCVFIGSMIMTAVSSYINGEKSSREYKNKFYVELIMFIDKFFSWAKITPQADEDGEEEKS